MLPNHVKFV